VTKLHARHSGSERKHVFISYSLTSVSSKVRSLLLVVYPGPCPNDSPLKYSPNLEQNVLCVLNRTTA